MSSKDVVERKLKQILQGVQEVNKREAEWDWYTNLIFGEDYDDEEPAGEDVLAEAAIQHPELHPLMVEIVEGIIDLNEPEDAVSINDEAAAGAQFAAALALHDVQYVDLLARHYRSGDPDHTEVEFYYEDITAILEQYGYRRETYPLIFALYFVHSQHLGEYFSCDEADLIATHLKEGNNRQIFLEDLARWVAPYRYSEYALEELFYLVGDAFDVDGDDEEAFEAAVKKLKEMLKHPETISVDGLKA